MGSLLGLTVFFLLTCILGTRLATHSEERRDRYDYIPDR